MSKVNKTNNLYKTPFTPAYWRDACAELRDTKMLVFAALMIAIRVALKLVAIPLAPNLKINTAFLANALGAMVFGPVVAAVSAVVSDFLGVLITGDVYFLPMVLLEISGSVLFALFLYRARVTPTRVILSRFAICLLVNVFLQTPLMMLYYKMMMGGSSYVLTVPKIIKNLFMFPIESVVLTVFLAFIQPITYRLKLTYDPGTKAAPACELGHKGLFTRRQIALLTVLFVFGCGCVAGYLGYHYDTTSLTTGYTTEERVEKNRQMHEIILEETEGGINTPSVAIIESAYKPFLGQETTYNVAFYAVSGEVTDDLWELKKTPASKHEALSLVGNAVIVMNDRNEEMLDFDYTDLNCDH
ncbi:MAG: folate family ECF transporter S component [Oscillospiraceae bacterium]|nr:folate family ECF transporter S component [Oscillospiraceae bacterium]